MSVMEGEDMTPQSKLTAGFASRKALDKLFE